jgi:hypothetical protein
MVDLSIDSVVDILSYLGYSSEQLPFKDRIHADAFKLMGGNHGRNVSKRSLIVFINAINNVFLTWMTEDGRMEDLKVKSEKEVAQIHYRFFAFWEHR